ncbi:MAG: hypothetical protein NVSMB26_13550 [Beijerinckiaceae bacterium]
MLIATASAQAELACTFEQMQINPASVIEPCSRAVDTDQSSDKAQAFYVRGRAYARTGRTTLAANDFDVALKFAPNRSDILVSRANAELKLGRSAEGRNDLQRALALNPNEARAWFAIGQEYLNSGDADQALTAFGRALASDPAEPYSLLMRSQVFVSRHQFAEAMADATALVNIPPAIINKLGYVDARGVMTNFHVVALNHRASLYERTGDQAAADRDLERAIAEQPSASTFQHRAESLLQHKEPEQALKDIDEAVRLDPADGDVQFLRGLILATLNRYAEGLDALDKAIAVHQHVIVSREQLGMDYLMRARMLRGLGKTDDAVATITRAVAISPEVKGYTITAMNIRGYWKDEGTAAQGATFQAALRACMIDKDCN